MRNLPTVVVVAIALTLTGLATLIGASSASASTGGAAPVPTSAHSGQTLEPGTDLRSANGEFLFTVSSTGELAIIKKGKTIWSTTPRTAKAKVVLRTDGNVAMVNQKYDDLWETGTWHAGHDTLEVSDSGVLTLSGNGGTVWSSALGNGCGSSKPEHRVLVHIATQRARLCEYDSQILVTSVTTGASSIGDATPTGTWEVYEKLSPTVLYPSGGGAYHVKYWMPYNGAYGMHDSPWQKFAYGSSEYKTKGSHGCVHFPAAAMTRLYGWAPVGTTVRVY
jgi:hypothetical protein